MERFFVRRLLLSGPGRTYDAEFGVGVNLIAGPIFTGKSSVLALIDYCCGKQTHPRYAEIQKCSDVFLEVSVGGEILTIRRSLKSVQVPAMLYENTIAEVLKDSPPYIEVSARQVAGGDSISTELMGRLGLGGIQIKCAPTKDNSKTQLFSFRNLLNLMHLDQERVASKYAFFEDMAPKAIPWRAGFEIVHNVYDGSLATLADSLREARNEEDRIAGQLEAARRFLNSAKIPSLERLETEDANANQELVRLTELMAKRRLEARALMGENLELVQRRDQVQRERATARARIVDLERTLRPLGRLRVQYERERSQLEFLQESDRFVGSLPVVRCPACFQLLRESEPESSSCHTCHQELPEQTTEVSVEVRLKALKRKTRDLERYIAELKSTIVELREDDATMAKKEGDLNAALARVRQGALFPQNQAIADAQEALALARTKARELDRDLNLRKRSHGEGSRLAVVRERREKLEKALNEAKKHSISKETIVDSLSSHYRAWLALVRFPDLHGVKIDPKGYLPIVRDQMYRELSSLGAISLAVVGWHLALLRQALEQETRFPMFLMIDSPLAQVGRAGSDEVFKDQAIVDSFYQAIVDLHTKHAPDLQVLIVENNPPEMAKSLIAVQFSGDPHEGRYGLIDDEHPVQPPG